MSAGTEYTLKEIMPEVWHALDGEGDHVAKFFGPKAQANAELFMQASDMSLMLWALAHGWTVALDTTKTVWLWYHRDSLHKPSLVPAASGTAQINDQLRAVLTARRTEAGK